MARLLPDRRADRSYLTERNIPGLVHQIICELTAHKPEDATQFLAQRIPSLAAAAARGRPQRPLCKGEELLHPVTGAGVEPSSAAPTVADRRRWVNEARSRYAAEKEELEARHADRLQRALEAAQAQQLALQQARRRSSAVRSRATSMTMASDAPPLHYGRSLSVLSGDLEVVRQPTAFSARSSLRSSIGGGSSMIFAEDDAADVEPQGRHVTRIAAECKKHRDRAARRAAARYGERLRAALSFRDDEVIPDHVLTLWTRRASASGGPARRSSVDVLLPLPGELAAVAAAAAAAVLAAAPLDSLEAVARPLRGHWFEVRCLLRRDLVTGDSASFSAVAVAVERARSLLRDLKEHAEKEGGTPAELWRALLSRGALTGADPLAGREAPDPTVEASARPAAVLRMGWGTVERAVEAVQLLRISMENPAELGHARAAVEHCSAFFTKAEELCADRRIKAAELIALL